MLARLHDQLNRVLAGRRVIVAFDHAGAATPFVTWLDRIPGLEVLVLAASEGGGPNPECETIMVDLDIEPTSIMDGFRAYDRALADPPKGVMEAVDRFDPDGDALVFAAPYSSLLRSVGRRVYGHRAPEWQALENKVEVDALWDRAGVVRASSSVVPVTSAAAAAADLDLGAGTVWAADNRDGWHGGGDRTRWVTDDVGDAVAWFSARADSVRIMPFLEGRPCAIHGFVTPSGTAAFRPIEMVVLRTATGNEFVYAGCSTHWDPPPADREDMRAVAVSVGELLDAEVGYRGPFSIDGVLTADGFRPTELNPRHSAGFGMLAATPKGYPHYMATMAFIEGDVDIDPTWLEDLIVTAADENRVGGMGLAWPEHVDRAEEVKISFTDKAAVVTSGAADATLVVSQSRHGCYISMAPDTDAHAPGAPTAPEAAKAMRLAKSLWDLDLPECVAAPDVR